jgi:hypothetical protein
MHKRAKCRPRYSPNVWNGGLVVRVLGSWSWCPGSRPLAGRLVEAAQRVNEVLEAPLFLESELSPKVAALQAAVATEVRLGLAGGWVLDKNAIRLAEFFYENDHGGVVWMR